MVSRSHHRTVAWSRIPRRPPDRAAAPALTERLSEPLPGAVLRSEVGWRGRIRTFDLLIQSQAPYRLATRQWSGRDDTASPPHDPRRGPRHPPGTFGGVDVGGACWHRGAMTSASDRRPRLVALLLVVSLMTGFAATVSVSASPALPACKVADTLTKYRTYITWHRSLLDMTYRLSSTYKPTDLRSTSYAGLNSGFSVRAQRHRRPQGHGCGSTPSRRAPLGPVRVSKLRHAEVDIRLLGPGPGYAVALRRAPGPATASTSSARRSTSGAMAVRRRGTTRTGERPGPGHGSRPMPGNSASSCPTRRARPPSRATRTSRGTTAMSAGRGRPRSEQAA